MKAVTAIGLDIAKSVFQVHGIDAAGVPILCKRRKGAKNCIAKMGNDLKTTKYSGRRPPGSYKLNPDEKTIGLIKELTTYNAPKKRRLLF